MAGNKPADSAFPPRGWEDWKGLGRGLFKKGKAILGGSELAHDEGGARDPGPYTLRKRKQEALENENRRSNTSDPPYRRERGEEGEIGDGDALAASLPDTEKKENFVLSTSEGIMAMGSWRVEAASLLKARCQPDEYIRLVETGAEALIREGRGLSGLESWLRFPSTKKEFLPQAPTEA